MLSVRRLTWDCKQQSCNLAIAERPNNAREEILECLREQAHMLEECEEVQSIVLQRKLDAMPDTGRVCLIGFVDVVE